VAVLVREDVPNRTEWRKCMKIALLEDNPTNSEYIQTLLEMEGHEVFLHPYGHSLLTALQTIGDLLPYDVMIIDLWLPNSLSGQDVMHHLQKEYPSKRLPFIVVSALSQQELDRVQADFPETPIISKPFKSRQLLDAIHLVAKHEE
jgi:DNA-binding response OmpR family regulator